MLSELYQRHRLAFDRYRALLLQWNEKINLTAITDPTEIVERHFLDSLTLIPALLQWGHGKNVSRETFFEGLSLLDIGAGAGFPGLPLKIAFPFLHVTLIDSVKKKCDFLKEVIRSLKLSAVEVQHDLLVPNKSVGAFDFVVSRAAFALQDFIPLGAPSLKPTGHLIAYKGGTVELEVEESDTVREKFGLLPFKRYRYELAQGKVSHQLLMTSLSQR